MGRGGRIAIAFVLALAMTPAVAAERIADESATSEAPESTTLPEVVVESPGLRTSAFRQAVQGLPLLRLHPGRDLLDVTETARRRPARAAD